MGLFLLDLEPVRLHFSFTLGQTGKVLEGKDILLVRIFVRYSLFPTLVGLKTTCGAIVLCRDQKSTLMAKRVADMGSCSNYIRTPPQSPRDRI